MALELRPTCEHCNKALPPEAGEAMICSFECTFCRTCVEQVLENVCPNCGGGFSPRPIRPAANWRGDNFIGAYPHRQRCGTAPLIWRRIGPSRPRSSQSIRRSAEIGPHKMVRN
jgi:uncharacterized protein